MALNLCQFRCIGMTRYPPTHQFVGDGSTQLLLGLILILFTKYFELPPMD